MNRLSDSRTLAQATAAITAQVDARRLCRRTVLVRDHFSCQRCGKRVAYELSGTLYVHELIPQGRGGDPTDPDNCVALCFNCYRGITDRTVNDWEDWLKEP